MAKVVRNLKDSQREFQTVFRELCYTRSTWQVWSDFINMAAISISNACDRTSAQRQEREDCYLKIAKGYSKAELDSIVKMLGIVVSALEAEPDQDFLGDLFMALELGNHWKGQFFTPYSVCRMMAEIQMSDMDATLKRRGWVSINDCACGAGALLIAARNVMMRKGVDWSTSALFVAQDIDRTAALMCYIQLSFLGCAGYVVVADTLTQPLTGSVLAPCPEDYHDVWYMPCFYTLVWHYRRIGAQMDILFRNVEMQVPVQQPVPAAPPEPEQTLTETKTGQLSIF